MRLIDANAFVLKLRDAQIRCAAKMAVSRPNSSRWLQFKAISMSIDELIRQLKDPDCIPTIDAEPVRHGKKGKSTISSTGLMCTACYSDIDDDAVFCKYCGAKVEEDNHGTEQR